MSEPKGPPRKGPAVRRGAKLETLAVLALTLVLALTYLAARDSGPFQAVEGQALDWRFRLRGPQAVSPEIAIVAINDRTLAELGRWPFSRRWLAAAVEAVAADGAKAIVFDLLLVGRERGEEEGPVGADADGALAEAIARAGQVVVPFAFVYQDDTVNASVLPPVVERAAYPIVLAGADQLSEGPAQPAGALLPLAAFLDAGSPAHATVIVDADGSLRFTHPAIRYGDAYYPSLAVEAVRQFRDVDRQDLLLELGRGLSIGERFFATGADLALPINYAGPEGSYESWSLIDVAQGDFPPGTFRERLVLLGTDAAGISDRFETPYSPGLSGVEMLANVVDNFLARGFLRRTSLIEAVDVLAVVVAGSLAAALSRLRRPARAMLGAAALFAAWIATALYAFVAWQVWLNFLFPSLALLLGATIVTAGLAIRETRGRASAERRGATLSRYVSPLAISDLDSHAARTAGDRTGTAAVMFADLVGFTHASEALPPAEVARLLRRFHGSVERCAEAHDGVIDKFIGDAVLVVFGVPEGGPSDAADALACARRIIDELESWQGEGGGADGLGLACGIGIDYGAVSIAEVGGSAHAQVTVAGDTVNVASRLEALTREWSTKIIISDAVADAIRAAGAAAMLEGFRELPVHKLRGRERSVRLWAWPPGTAS